MTLILTNDDGIDAPGIRALHKAMNGKGVIVAPKDHLSGCGHQVTTTQAIHVRRRSDFEYAIAGTPADCVRIALTHLCPTVKFVLSGINAGGNLGADVYISGTVAAVREAAFHGVPGIAVSHYRKGKLNVDWDVAARWTAGILADLLNRTIEPGTFWNVNLPHLLPGDPDPEVVFCEPSRQPLPVNYRVEGDNFYYVGEYAKRDRTPGSDVDVCFSGKIAVTQLRL
ncbi:MULTISPECIES: 5'/3'-nucleotidase SurE [unclassified Coleofasciculus]|uniref:5'/3'-nucleotidase SurE n=1 Tax=Cyanophyceae TaxID=3028117 RepID=UPI00168749F1|nr:MULTISPECIES: 5'/3'-nucleotidase SurE [unclassified Coleofasciculus]MBD1880399.1 5'/3'-nucleotidase SurE [Coleofasciculus sp. FACHB-T130]MBD1896945.1 5'/3'-nucleotidase SurE [Coleofasciculus sp. FACHB-129]MBD1901211.1 5'/3'-nucleotidase SurE [Coleofasciculus sp. FACHB-125]